MTPSTWITDWSKIDDSKNYTVYPINARNDGSLYLGNPIQVYPGWAVKRLMKGCYAVLEQPEFRGVDQHD